MMKVGIISGTSIARSGIFDNMELQVSSTPYGEIDFKEANGIVVINRHGFRHPSPPHRTNYRGYAHLLKKKGVETTLSLNSVGSLDEDLLPGSLVSCSDYVSFAPITFIDDAPSAFAPSIDNRLLDRLESSLSRQIVKDRIYAQTRGPRFETKAEVRILQKWGCDVVGMTFAPREFVELVPLHIAFMFGCWGCWCSVFQVALAARFRSKWLRVCSLHCMSTCPFRHATKAEVESGQSVALGMASATESKT